MFESRALKKRFCETKKREGKSSFSRMSLICDCRRHPAGSYVVALISSLLSIILEFQVARLLLSSEAASVSEVLKKVTEYSFLVLLLVYEEYFWV